MNIKKFIPKLNKTAYSSTETYLRAVKALECVSIAAGSHYAMTSNQMYLYAERFGYSAKQKTITKQQAKTLKSYDSFLNNDFYIEENKPLIKYGEVIREVITRAHNKHIRFIIPKAELKRLLKQASAIRGKDSHKNISMRLIDAKLQMAHVSTLGEYLGESKEITFIEDFSPDIFACNFKHLMLITKMKAEELNIVVQGKNKPVIIFTSEFKEFLFISPAPTDDISIFEN